MRQLFQLANLPAPDASPGSNQLAHLLRASEADRQKIVGLLEQIRTKTITFDAKRIRRTLTGSAPRSCAWYPDAKMTSWIYYEPRVTFDRAMHEDRTEGWGTSNQWRDDGSHAISPKLAFTTKTDPEAGLKAFVLNDEWIVLKAAGTRQQLNYTGVENPLRDRQRHMDGANNLGDEALALRRALANRGLNAEDFLLYIAAIYNSALADDYLRQGGENTMRIPVDPIALDLDVVEALIGLARRIRNLSALSAKLTENATMKEVEALSLAPSDALEAFGLMRASGSGGRFAQVPTWTGDGSAIAAVNAVIHELRGEIDELVQAIFESLPALA